MVYLCNFPSWLHYANYLLIRGKHQQSQLSWLTRKTNWPGVGKGRARTQSPTLTNYAPEFPTLGGIAGFNFPGVQWRSLDLKELPCWSQYSLSQVSMKRYDIFWWKYLCKLLNIWGWNSSKCSFFNSRNEALWDSSKKEDSLNSIPPKNPMAYWFWSFPLQKDPGIPDISSLNNNMQTRVYLEERKRLLMEVVQYHGNLRAQVSKLSRESSLSKISLIFWTCCAGRIRY